MGIVDVFSVDLEVGKKKGNINVKSDKWLERDFYFFFMVRKFLNNEIL